MYEDAWYSVAPSLGENKSSSGGQHGHRRRESLLQQANGTNSASEVIKPLPNVYEEPTDTNTPPQATLHRRAASYSDFYHVARATFARETKKQKQNISVQEVRPWNALDLTGVGSEIHDIDDDGLLLPGTTDAQLLLASQQKYTVYQDQLTLTERHLDGLVTDVNATLKLLDSLSGSFASVESQTSTFQAQCEDLLAEQRRLEKLATEVGTDLHYYAYLESATRRLNAPGAGRLVEDEEFGKLVEIVDACIDFMNNHESYRDRDTYLARYSALLTKALHLLDHGFTSRLDKILAEIGPQIAATQSGAARHALAYGRFEEMITEHSALLHNIQRVTRRVYDQYGRRNSVTLNATTYVMAASNMFQAYLTSRDRDTKVLTQQDLEEFQKEIKTQPVDVAGRRFVKQCFERLYSEDSLFTTIFKLQPSWSTSPESVFQIIKKINTSMLHPGHLVPLATHLQSALQGAELPTICNLVGWLASEHSVIEQDEDETPFQEKCREYAARLLVEHIWPFTDTAFEAEINKSITKAVVPDSMLTIGPVEGGMSSSNALPIVKRALELLVMFDQSMPKERSAKDSPVVFRIVRETIQVLQRAEARIRSLKAETDPDLFMVKNLLIIKNELVSLEIGDIRSQAASMQHFGQIWDTLSPQNWVGFVSNIIGGSLWSRGSSAPAVTAKTLTVEDMSEQLDELLRQSIYGFTKRWGALINDSQARKAGVKPIAKLEAQLETILETAFSNQPEVIAKLKEAIELNARVHDDVNSEASQAKRY